MAKVKENSQEAARQSELERLRDILYGDYARDTSVKLEELDERLAKFRKDILKTLSDQDGALNNTLETNKQLLEDKIVQLSQSINDRIDKLEANLNQRLAQLDDAKSDRRDLGKMLVTIGQQLQAENQE